jgi:hypothetical protein
MRIEYLILNIKKGIYYSKNFASGYNIISNSIFKMSIL